MKHSLSDMQREKPAEPFIITVQRPAVDGSDKREPVDVEFANPKSLHWTKLVELDSGANPIRAVKILVADEDQRSAFHGDPDIDGAAFEWIMARFRTHFGLGDPGD